MMRCKLAFFGVLFIIGSICSANPSPNFGDFQEWMKTYEKTYTADEMAKRFDIYLNNHKLVTALNELYFGSTFELNQFADLTPSEFKSKILMTSRHSQNHELNRPDKASKPVDVEDLPDSFDWRDKGAVTPVKDQGSAGTCWAHSAVENIEGQYQLKGNVLTSLSVEQIVDCDGTTNVTGGTADCGVFGGWPYLAFEYVKRAGGLTAEKDYPYCWGNKNACFPCEAPGYNDTLCGPSIPFCYLKDSCQAKLDPSKFLPNLRVVDWVKISENETDIAAQMMSIGPLSIALNAEKLQFYHSGIFEPISCDPTALDHAVLMVGWGVEKSKPFWIIKNSWGAKWGENGYFRILRGKGKCGLNTQVVSAILA